MSGIDRRSSFIFQNRSVSNARPVSARYTSTNRSAACGHGSSGFIRLMIPRALPVSAAPWTISWRAGSWHENFRDHTQFVFEMDVARLLARNRSAKYAGSETLLNDSQALILR